MKRLSMTENSALSASGSWNGCPGASRAETPPSGITKQTGPSIRFSLSTMKPPISLHSSGVVRISVTFGLCRYRRRFLNWVGTVSIAQKLTMSSAPQEPT